MQRWLKSVTSSQSVKAKSLRGAMFVVLSFSGGNILRLASNLVLTRLLFPEAFGLMALVQVFITGLTMFSDAGIRTAIIRNARGDDPDFLNTAWTVQIIRGVLLWLGACTLAYPVALIYDTPMLAMLLPVAGLNALVSGFTPTKVLQANRHLVLGRVITLELTSQFIGIVAMIILAYLMGSVWALVIGGLLGTVIRVFLQYRFLPGLTNQLRWETSAMRELFHFGKFILLSTAVTFVIKQGDKAILGGFISLAELGIYNIAAMLAGVAHLLCTAFNSKIIQPLYRMKPLHDSAQNRRQVFRARRLTILSVVILNGLLGYFGVALVELMYDERFAAAGPMVVLICAALVPRMVFLGYGGVLLAVGDSKKFFYLNLATGVVQLILMYVGILWLGIFGVILAPCIATILVHPLRVFWVRPHNGWDALGDSLFLLIGGGLAIWTCMRYWEEIQLLMG